MSKLNRMQRTPWHIDALSREQGDPRRHRSYCVHYDKTQKHCNVMNMRCMGSAHCDEYVDSTNYPVTAEDNASETSQIYSVERKLIPIKDVYPGRFILQDIKMSEVEFEKQHYHKHGCFSGNIVIELCVSKYYIQDGYLYYYTAKQMGHEEVTCIIKH